MLVPPVTPTRARVVSAPLTFIVPGDTKPAFLSAALNGGTERFLFDTAQVEVPIEDVRPRASTLSLDREGFVLRRAPSAVRDWTDDEAIDATYLDEVKALVARELGARAVAVLDVTRRSDAEGGAANRGGARRGPASQVHVDYTVTSGPVRAAAALGEDVLEAHLAAGGRVVQVNVWRPTRGPVQRMPLALADASSIRPEALVATDQRFPDRVGEIYLLRHQAGQRWFFAPSMTPDETLLLKSWDSAEDGRARFTPHTAFHPPDTPASAPPRESIEVRTFALV